ncbi:MAG: hypothetical protein ACOX1F_00960 [Erysipelotrichaceae bacterium]|jgi:hypothetical protein
MSKEIVEKIKALAYENINKKLEKEREKTEKRIADDLADVEKALSYIANRLVYKTVSNSFCVSDYVLATEEMFFNDYNKEVEYSPGLKFSNDYRDGWLFLINGEFYYDVRKIIKNYERDFDYFKRRFTDLNESFKDLVKKYEVLKTKDKQIKSILEQLEKVKIEEEVTE